MARRKDRDAADLIRRLRTREGLSPEALSLAVRQHGTSLGYPARRVAVSGDLIRLIERRGHEPGPRIKFALSLYFGLAPGQIWARDDLGDIPVRTLQEAA